MKLRATILCSCLGGVFAPGARAQGNDLAAPMAIVVGDGPRAAALESIVRDAGMRRRRIASAKCTAADLRLGDVVVVDWPAEVALGDALPLGELDRWDRPTVFVGSSGERFASAWGLPGPGELERMPPHARGPEMQHLAPTDGAVTGVWRQGHLFHFACAASQEDFPAVERAWLQHVLRMAATFVSDRPILRHAAANGAPLPAAEAARRQRLEAAATALSLDPADMNVLLRLPDRLEGEQGEVAATLLQDLIAEGPGPDTTRNNWHSWLKPRLGAMVWDPLSRVWRIDPLALGRGVATPTVRGAARADGGPRDPAAVALATRVVQHHGGRAFDDLTTFSCWQGDVCYQWDRRGGWFRIENHHVLPPGARAVPWDLAVLDTAADADVIWGGGPPPRPRVSARQAFRSLITQSFLPLMLLDPGTSLQLRPEADSADQKALVVRLAHRCLDPRIEYQVMVASNGAIASVQESRSGRLLALSEVTATTPCGPMSLPTGWRRRGTDYALEDPAWNPELPAGIATSTTKLTAPRDR